MVLGGIGQFFPSITMCAPHPNQTHPQCAQRNKLTRDTAKHRQGVIVGIYVTIFGLCKHHRHQQTNPAPSTPLLTSIPPATGLLEFQIPPQIARYASFMFSFLGRGIFYLFVGCIIMGDNWWKYTAGSIVALVGIAYVGLEFVPSIEPPANMR